MKTESSRDVYRSFSPSMREKSRRANASIGKAHRLKFPKQRLQAPRARGREHRHRHRLCATRRRRRRRRRRPHRLHHVAIHGELCQARERDQASGACDDPTRRARALDRSIASAPRVGFERRVEVYRRDVGRSRRRRKDETTISRDATTNGMMTLRGGTDDDDESPRARFFSVILGGADQRRAKAGGAAGAARDRHEQTQPTMD